MHLDTSCTDMDGDGTPDQIDSVALTGPWWGWDAAAGAPAADADGDGVWTVEFENVLTDVLEYKWVVNGMIEPDLVGAGFCADKTNPSNPFTNRIWLPGDGDTTEYPGTCLACDQADWTWQAPCYHYLECSRCNGCLHPRPMVGLGSCWRTCRR